MKHLRKVEACAKAFRLRKLPKLSETVLWIISWQTLEVAVVSDSYTVYLCLRELRDTIPCTHCSLIVSLLKPTAPSNRRYKYGITCTFFWNENCNSARVGPNSIALYVPMKIILVEKISNPDHQIPDRLSSVAMNGSVGPFLRKARLRDKSDC